MGRKSKSHIRKPEILRHTYKVVEEEGFVGTTITKIASRMGVNSGLLIHYFKNKDELILALVDYLLETSIESYHKLLNGQMTPAQRLKTLIDIFFEPNGKSPTRGKVYWSCYAMGLRNEKVWKRIQKLNQKFIEFAISEMELYEKAGLIKVEDKDLAAITAFTIIEGFGYVRYTLGDVQKLDQLSRIMKKQAMEALGVIDIK
ncbi:TetR/AcrR family transcriptional regulator [Desulforhopalus singaporensis]|uniref:Biofilm operon icaADBC HTH-type negative transcriptional regulator IcaR n=1 Tax=Desulforhopalus singaporensis TaxID=91360 RepID=A0A1H0SCQ6_9BACT|nr:TetR family transcriptional regulator [Desulforhopalus singaporensis]SDP39591.1 transcriptional regulator, TetR family [Desulforhopalus singaporensis]